MVLDIQSKEVIDKISDELKVQPSLEIPRQLAEKIQLVYNVNPLYQLKIANVTVADSTSGTLHIPSTTKKTFVVGMQLVVNKDAVSDSTLARIVITPRGRGLITAIAMGLEPTTAAQALSEVVMFPVPMEVEPGATIQILNQAGTASIDVQGTLYYYETDVQ